MGAYPTNLQFLAVSASTHHLSLLRDRLVEANEGPAAELVESAIQSLQDACRALLGRTTEGVSR
jgi:hypothetical protein